ncbi:putative FAD-dependent pyridine nucleotide-disulfide oxidoreductase [Megalodesulfovibrio gigas DSM 1382 = ATCC 19364]|uniref:Putative FAD-dependent pyridine nucleotide-disulfide oxidoreductase n=1 Tax=Megalodesulfovibrio gigas (strain ATCC 19364 / DSM 1382 / NCIMB 9332 / VKM B-1759) TaxID=1121448 RepID=T2GAH9_MEGG1|nr:putative FAD-dependent pyridine nucleotide-disulfide oxidoreductase [Megalodesulfovibrio gigas DSM 1382 = ATCC 19364]
MSISQRVLVIGGVALGPKAACRIKRLDPHADVTVLEATSHFSYGGCGIPYYVSGDVSDIKELSTTSFHVLRDAPFFRDAKGVAILANIRALAINRDKKTVTVRHESSGATEDLPYDKLVIATGASPRRLNAPGEDLPGISAVANLAHAAYIKDMVAAGKVGKAVVVGAGFIGLEMAEAFADMWGIETTVVEFMPQLMPNLVSPGLATMAVQNLEKHGVTMHFGEKVVAFEGDGKLERVVTDKRVIEADLAIVAVGVTPNSELAKAAGLDVAPNGGIVVNEYLQTTDPDIYAGGDCIALPNLLTGQLMHLPMGSMANRQGRIIGDNLAGLQRTFPGAVGSFCVKLFDHALTGTGLCLAGAKRAGYDAVNVHLSQLDRAHFYPSKALMYLDLVVDKATRRVLGIQGFTSQMDAVVGRINVVAGLLPRGLTVDELSNVEMAYSPPFAAAMDILNALANAADNLLAGRHRPVSPDEFGTMWADAEQDGLCFLDVRANPDGVRAVERLKMPNYLAIPQDEIPGRLGELPADKKLVLLCNTGTRAYEAQIMLDQAGRESIAVQGGLASVEKMGVDV